MAELPQIFSPATVAMMTADDIARVAGESQDSQEMRRCLEEKVKALGTGADICKEMSGCQLDRESLTPKAHIGPLEERWTN